MGENNLDKRESVLFDDIIIIVSCQIYSLLALTNE